MLDCLTQIMSRIEVNGSFKHFSPQPYARQREGCRVAGKMLREHAGWKRGCHTYHYQTPGSSDALQGAPPGSRQVPITSSSTSVQLTSQSAACHDTHKSADGDVKCSDWLKARRRPAGNQEVPHGAHHPSPER